MSNASESKVMASETNLYRTENYQNYINSFHRKSQVEKSISDVKKKIDDDNESINSVAESLNNYLDVKVCVARLIDDLTHGKSFHVTSLNVIFRSSMMPNQWRVASRSLRAKRRKKPNRCSGENVKIKQALRGCPTDKLNQRNLVNTSNVTAELNFQPRLITANHG